MFDHNEDAPADSDDGSGQLITARRPLHEMGFADILDTTFSLYRSNFWLFIGITATLHIPFGIIHILLVDSVEEGVAAQISSGLLGIIRILFIHPMVMGALVFAIAREYLGKETTVSEAFGRVRFVSILGASLLIGLAVGAMAMTIIGLPFSLYFGFRWSLFCPCVMVEGHHATGAMRRSSELVKGAWWRVFGIQVVLSVITAAVAGGVGYVSGAILDRVMGTGQLITSTLTNLLPIFTTPIMLIGATLLYFDLRIRKEAFDIEMMAQNIQTDV